MFLSSVILWETKKHIEENERGRDETQFDITHKYIIMSKEQWLGLC